jgi:hypothetical protein
MYFRSQPQQSDLHLAHLPETRQTTPLEAAMVALGRARTPTPELILPFISLAILNDYPYVSVSDLPDIALSIANDFTPSGGDVFEELVVKMDEVIRTDVAHSTSSRLELRTASGVPIDAIEETTQ